MCTALLYTDIHGNAYKGRTLEYSFRVPTFLTFVPAGSYVESMTPDGQKGMSFNTKYSFLGMSGDIVPGAKQSTFCEGANDQGLTFSFNTQNNSKTPALSNDASKTLTWTDFGSWALGNFKTVDEVRAAVEAADIWLPIVPFCGNVPAPWHAAVWDRSGKGIVIEFLNGKKIVYDNPVGAMTNGPEFSWHLTNLNNYTFNNVNQNQGQFGNLKVQTDDAGIALSSLPSSETATGRFVKAAFYVNYVEKAKTPDDAVLMLGHIMNNFDRPANLTIDVGSTVGDGPVSNSASSEVTEWTVMNDLSRNLLYVRAINSLNWTLFDLNKMKDLKKSKSITSYDANGLGSDGTSYFLS